MVFFLKESMRKYNVTWCLWLWEKKSHGWGSGLFIFNITSWRVPSVPLGRQAGERERLDVSTWEKLQGTACGPLPGEVGLNPSLNPWSYIFLFLVGRWRGQQLWVGERVLLEPSLGFSASLLLPAPFPFLSFRVPWPPTPAQACLALLAKQLRAAAVAGLGLLRPPCPQERGMDRRITWVWPSPSVSLRSREGIPFMIADVSPICQALSSGSTDTAEFRQHLQTGPFHASPATSTLNEDSGLCQVRGGGGEGRVGVCCSLQLGLCSLAPATSWPLSTSRAAWMQTPRC